MASSILMKVDTSFSKIVERLLESMGSRLDTNAGSIARTLAEAYAREMATFYQMLELSHASGYLDTAQGGALDNVVAILGIKRARAGRLIGYIELSRSSAAPDDISIPARVQVTGADDAAATPMFATTTAAVLRRGDTRVVVPVQEEDYDPLVASTTPVINPGTLTMMPHPLLGIDGVSNLAPLRRGSEDESDEDLRSRARVALREGEGGTLAAIAAAVRKEGVRQVTVREPEGGPPGVIEVVIADRDFGAIPGAVTRVEQAIRESKAAGVRAKLFYAKTVYFQPRLAVEPADPNLEDAGFDVLRRALEDDIARFGARQPVGETIRRRRLEATLFGNPAVRNVGEITMRTFVWDLDAAGKRGLVAETKDRQLGAQGDWVLSPLETAVFDVAMKPPEITRLRPPTYRFALLVAVTREERRTTDTLRQAVRDGLAAYAGWLAKNFSTTVRLAELGSKLAEQAGISALRSVLLTAPSGLSIKLGPTEYSLAADFRLEAGSIEVVIDA